MNWKGLFLVLGLLLTLPGYAAASPAVPDLNNREHMEKKPCNCHEGKGKHEMHRDWQAKMKQKEQQLLSWVNQYTPDKKAEWNAAIAERKSLFAQWMSPGNAAKREQWKKAKKAKIEELHKQYKEGKITKEQFMEQAHGGKKMGTWKTYHDLETAVEAKNTKQAAQLLNQLLTQFKQQNQLMKEMLKK